MIGLHESHRSGEVGDVRSLCLIDRKKSGGGKVVGRWARSVAPVGVMALALLCGGQKAHAGRWEVTLESRRVGEVYTWDTPQQEMETRSLMTGTDNTDTSDGAFSVNPQWPVAASFGRKGNETTLDATMTYTLKLHWVFDVLANPPALPPTKINMLISSQATINWWPASNGAGTVSNGLDGKVEEKSASIQNLLGQTVTRKTKDSKSSFLVQHDNSARATDVIIGPFQVTTDGHATGALQPDLDGEGSWRDPGSQIWTSGFFSAKFDPRSVSISSDIEPSYKKVTDASALPQFTDLYTGVTGYDLSKIRSTTPTNGAGPWGVLCEPNPNGSMTVESAVSYVNLSGSGGGGTESWWGSVGLAAQTSGFAPYAPTFSGGRTYGWQVQGGSALTDEWHLPELDLHTRSIPSQSSSPNTANGILLGGDIAGVNMARHSNVKVEVTDGDGVIGEANYGINWHMPFDNVTENAETATTPPQTYYTAVPAMTTGALGYQESTQDKDGSLEVWLDPSETRFWVGFNGNDWTLLGAAATGFTGGSALAVRFGIVEAATFANAIPAAAVCFGQLGWQVYTTNGPAASEKQQCVNSSSMWQQAVAETTQAQNGAQNADIRIEPAGMLNNLTQAQKDDSNWDTNPLWKQFKMTPWIKRIYEYHFFRGDSYDEHGYSGVGRAHLDLPKSADVVGYYSFVGTPSNP